MQASVNGFFGADGYLGMTVAPSSRMRIYINFPYLSGLSNSMGLFVRDLAQVFSSAGLDVVVCSIQCVPLGFQRLNVPKVLLTSVGRIDSISLNLRMLVELIRSRNFVVLNVSQEFICPFFLHRSVVIVHDTIQTEYPRSRSIKWLSRFWWQKARKCAVTISVSAATHSDLRKLGIKSCVIYNHFDAEFAATPTLRSAGPRQFAAMWCGTLDAHKNIELYIDLCRCHCELAFCAVLPQAAVTSLRERQAPRNLTLFASLSRTEYIRLLHSSTMLISTSRKEGYGRPPMEALLCRTPVLLSDISVYREIYGDFATFHNQSIESLDEKFLALRAKVAAGTARLPSTSELARYHGDLNAYVLEIGTLLGIRGGTPSL